MRVVISQAHNQNGIVINANDKVVFRSGKKIEIPSYIRGNNITNINGKIYIDGYELLPNGKWKRTLKAMWHKLF
ncbi:hypothetical protein M5X00_26075 [Paenibacillus alvei]|uniref:hypothetical protein n=1 Tax=Paenibacillus alvei TaxID=44250 RepID=UPI000288D6AD|nr:hypothetical protein [Paenibacillus alvei]EJW13918.1 hypothetical protein PAV_141p00240 [Paenibacillus alvei DSM 29]MCY9544710.1 hypothetical protein [Paenibacillus alvei]MCY9707718.1 hypothetical protein [Paenibacillus alvei]MCY9757699.1 hypothetical protein [Paenibacillus alvei]MEC0082769.1 hypothetical protein [Paenibacillus alvei]